MNLLIKKPSKEDQKIASKSLEEFESLESEIRSKNKGGIKITIQGSKESITVPKNALVMLKSIVENMAEGNVVAVLPQEMELTSQQAADILGVSRPHVIKLLKEKKIPFKKVGSHRRILFRDLLDYQEKQTKEREKQLDFLAKQAQDLQLGY